MHMHTHLADCILDYGPMYSFWLFSFERYNGILGNYSTTNKLIELQIMRKFLRDQNLREFEFPDQYAQHFKDLTEKLQHRGGHQSETHLLINAKLAIEYLAEVYKIFFPGISTNTIPLLYDKYASIEFAGERYGSSFSCLNHFAYILAKWADRFNGNVDMESEDERPGIIDCFIGQSISYDDKVYLFCFAYVSWFQHHPERFHYGSDGVIPEIWCVNLF